MENQSKNFWQKISKNFQNLYPLQSSIKNIFKNLDQKIFFAAKNKFFSHSRQKFLHKIFAEQKNFREIFYFFFREISHFLMEIFGDRGPLSTRDCLEFPQILLFFVIKYCFFSRKIFWIFFSRIYFFLDLFGYIGFCIFWKFYFSFI